VYDPGGSTLAWVRAVAQPATPRQRYHAAVLRRGGPATNSIHARDPRGAIRWCESMVPA